MGEFLKRPVFAVANILRSKMILEIIVLFSYGLTAYAADDKAAKKAQVKIENEVKIEKTFAKSFQSIKAAAFEEKWIAEILKATPAVQSAEVFAVGDVIENQSEETTISRKKTSWVTLDTVQLQTLGQFLVKLEYTEKTCKAGKTCTPSTNIVISGPKKNYKSVVPVFHSLQPSLLDGSILGKINLEESATNTKVSFALEFANRKFHQFFSQLVEKKILTQIPTESNIQTTFLGWADERLNALEKGGVL